MIRRHPILSVLVLLIVALAVVIWQNRIHLAAFPGIIGAYTAKEYCSCRYVMGNSADYCQAYPSSTCRPAASSTTKRASG